MQEGAPNKVGKKDAPDYEAFDPVLEFEKIRQAPKAERRQAIKSYKEKLFSQKEGIAELEESLREKFFKKPDEGEEYFLAVLNAETAKYKLSESQYAIFRDTIREAIKRRAVLKDWRKKFLDDWKFFKKLFGFAPAGDIKIEVGPLNFRIKIHNIHDFARISEGAFRIGRGATNEDVNEALITYGMHLTPLSKGLDGAVVILNLSEEAKEEAEATTHPKPPYREALDHEEQHVFNGFLTEQKIEKYFSSGLSFDMPAKREEFSDWFALVVRTSRRHGVEWNFKNEALAFLRGGTDPAEIQKRLLDQKGHYSPQWFIDKAKRAAKFYSAALSRKEGEDYGTLTEKIVEQVMGDELLKVERKAREAMEKLAKIGISRGKIVALLQNEPLTRWPNFARRYLKTI